MYNIILLTGYIFTTFSALLAMILIFIVKKGNVDRKGLYLRARNFTILSFLVEFNYLLSFYKELLLHNYCVGPIWRTFDYIVWISVYLTWISLIYALANNSKMQKINKYYRYFTFAMIVLFSIGCIILMDEYYFVQDRAGIIYLLVLTIIFFITSSIVLSFGLFYGLMENTSSLTQKYMVVVTICLISIHINHVYADTNLYFGNFGISGWAIEKLDVLWLAFLIINVATILFIYKTDFSPIYYHKIEDASNKSELTNEELELYKLNRISEVHRLTEREREVMACAYKGMTNPEISDHLYISRNTVKKHMHNIFEKLDVSSRTELIYMIGIYEEREC